MGQERKGQQLQKHLQISSNQFVGDQLSSNWILVLIIEVGLSASPLSSYYSLSMYASVPFYFFRLFFLDFEIWFLLLTCWIKLTIEHLLIVCSWRYEMICIDSLFEWFFSGLFHEVSLSLSYMSRFQLKLSRKRNELRLLSQVSFSFYGDWG